MNNALVYIHIFADGTKYFGNAVNPKRPFDFTTATRNKQWLAAFEKSGNPVVQIRRNLSVVEADNLEKWLFERYIANGGMKIQKRPNGKDLATLHYTNLGNKNGVGNKGFTGKHTDAARRKISEGGKGNTNGAGNKGTKRSDETKAKMSAASKGKPKSPTAIANSTARSHRKVISMLDGRVTSAGASGRWNRKNPDYIGTWVDL
jgi:hypothetical protein